MFECLCEIYEFVRLPCSGRGSKKSKVGVHTCVAMAAAKRGVLLAVAAILLVHSSGMVPSGLVRVPHSRLRMTLSTLSPQTVVPEDVAMKKRADDPLFSLESLDGLLLRQLSARCRATDQGLVQRVQQSDASKLHPLAELSIGEWASRSLYATRLSSIPLNRCYIADSHIPGAGKGVFAKCDMRAGSLVTLYPGDAVHIEDLPLNPDIAGGGSENEVWFSAESDGSLFVPPSELLKRGRDYEIEVDSNFWPTSLLGDPTKLDDSAYLGHMLNDGATCDSNARGAKADYSIHSFRHRNAKQVCASGCHAAIVTTRDVAAGEELLLTYGANYWIHRLLAKHRLREIQERSSAHTSAVQ